MNNGLEYDYSGICLEGFLYGTISVLPLFANAAQHCLISGLYCGTFIIYLQYYASKKGDKANNILFYALCLLHVLSVTTVLLRLANFIWEVNKNASRSTLLIICADPDS